MRDSRSTVPWSGRRKQHLRKRSFPAAGGSTTVFVTVVVVDNVVVVVLIRKVLHIVSIKQCNLICQHVAAALTCCSLLFALLQHREFFVVAVPAAKLRRASGDRGGCRRRSSLRYGLRGPWWACQLEGIQLAMQSFPQEIRGKDGCASLFAVPVGVSANVLMVITVRHMHGALT